MRLILLLLLLLALVSGARATATNATVNMTDPYVPTTLYRETLSNNCSTILLRDNWDCARTMRVILESVTEVTSNGTLVKVFDIATTPQLCTHDANYWTCNSIAGGYGYVASRIVDGPLTYVDGIYDIIWPAKTDPTNYLIIKLAVRSSRPLVPVPVWSDGTGQYFTFGDGVVHLHPSSTPEPSMPVPTTVGAESLRVFRLDPGSSSIWFRLHFIAPNDLSKLGPLANQPPPIGPSLYQILPTTTQVSYGGSFAFCPNLNVTNPQTPTDATVILPVVYVPPPPIVLTSTLYTANFTQNGTLMVLRDNWDCDRYLHIRLQSITEVDSNGVPQVTYDTRLTYQECTVVSNSTVPYSYCQFGFGSPGTVDNRKVFIDMHPTEIMITLGWRKLVASNGFVIRYMVRSSHPLPAPLPQRGGSFFFGDGLLYPYSVSTAVTSGNDTFVLGHSYDGPSVDTTGMYPSMIEPNDVAKLPFAAQDYPVGPRIYVYDQDNPRFSFPQVNQLLCGSVNMSVRGVAFNATLFPDEPTQLYDVRRSDDLLEMRLYDNWNCSRWLVARLVSVTEETLEGLFVRRESPGACLLPNRTGLPPLDSLYYGSATCGGGKWDVWLQSVRDQLTGSQYETANVVVREWSFANRSNILSIQWQLTTSQPLAVPTTRMMRPTEFPHTRVATSPEEIFTLGNGRVSTYNYASLNDCGLLSVAARGRNGTQATIKLLMLDERVPDRTQRYSQYDPFFFNRPAVRNCSGAPNTLPACYNPPVLWPAVDLWPPPPALPLPPSSSPAPSSTGPGEAPSSTGPGEAPSSTGPGEAPSSTGPGEAPSSSTGEALLSSTGAADSSLPLSSSSGGNDDGRTTLDPHQHASTGNVEGGVDNPASSSSSLSTGAIAGIALGSITAVAGTVAIAWRLARQAIGVTRLVGTGAQYKAVQRGHPLAVPISFVVE